MQIYRESEEERTLAILFNDVYMNTKANRLQKEKTASDKYRAFHSCDKSLSQRKKNAGRLQGKGREKD